MRPEKILCLLLALASVACSLQANADQLQEVNAFMEERWRVFEDRDAEGTVDLYTDDAIVINVTGDKHVGKNAISAFYQRIFSGLIPSELGPLRCKEATIQAISTDAAIHTQECTLYDVLPPEKAKGRRLPIRHFVATHVLVKGDLGWKIVAFRNIPIWNPFDWKGPNR